jgi:hypothetical protein
MSGLGRHQVPSAIFFSRRLAAAIFFASTAVFLMPYGTQWDLGCGIDVHQETDEDLRAFDQAFAASLDG